jgi:hypothetical protein
MANGGASAEFQKLEIVVNGEIELGTEQVLETDDPYDAKDEAVVDSYGKTGANRWTKLRSPAIPYLDVERRLLEHKLVQSAEPLPMSDQGLVLQYGILGGPGSGKTNLMMHLLHQIMAHERGNSVLKYGGLILDPKAALIAEVQAIFRRLGREREKDLIVVNETDLANGGVNVIDCPLAPSDLGEALVLAARSAGIGASEPFWLQQMAKVFGSIIALMKYQRPNEPPTLAQLMDVAVGHGILQGTIKNVRESVEKTNPNDPALKNVKVELEILDRYVSASDPKQRQVVSQIMEQAFSIFRLSENACYSVNRAPRERSLYDQIIEDGKVILVSVGPQKLVLSRILPSLMKLIFQRTVLSRFDRYRSGDPHMRNKDRPVLFLADEYHTVATQLQGVPFGDSEFFSQARQFGALCLVATQSVEQLQRSGLGDAWKAVFATLAAIVFMRGQDPATRQYLEQLAGPREYRVRRRDHSRNEGKEGVSWSVEHIEASSIPKGLLEGFVRGDAVVVGTTQGTTEPTTIRYVHVPRWDKFKLRRAA